MGHSERLVRRILEYLIVSRLPCCTSYWLRHVSQLWQTELRLNSLRYGCVPAGWLQPFWRTHDSSRCVWRSETLWSHSMLLKRALTRGSSKWFGWFSQTAADGLRMEHPTGRRGWVDLGPLSNNTGFRLRLMQRLQCQRQVCVCACMRHKHPDWIIGSAHIPTTCSVGQFSCIRFLSQTGMSYPCGTRLPGFLRAVVTSCSPPHVLICLQMRLKTRETHICMFYKWCCEVWWGTHRPNRYNVFA